MVPDLPETGTKLPALFSSAMNSRPLVPDASPASAPRDRPADRIARMAWFEARGSPVSAKEAAYSGFSRSSHLVGTVGTRSVFTPNAITPYYEPAQKPSASLISGALSSHACTL